MNLKELKMAVEKMTKLKMWQEKAKQSMINGFFHNSNLFAEFCGTGKEANKRFVDRLESIEWKHSLEKWGGRTWANIFACVSDNPTTDSVVGAIYQYLEESSSSRSEVVDMILKYEDAPIDQMIDRAKFICGFSWPTEHLTWVQYAANPVVPENIDHYGYIAQKLRYMWTNVIGFITLETDAKFDSATIEKEITRGMTEMEDKIHSSCERAAEYLVALDWVSEYRKSQSDKFDKEVTIVSSPNGRIRTQIG